MFGGKAEAAAFCAQEGYGHLLRFDSQREYERYTVLWSDQEDCIIHSLELQPEFVLQDGFTLKGKKIQAITYYADFMYIQDDVTIIEDVKGVKTDVFSIKYKLFMSRYRDLFESGSWVFRLVE